jgi:branched-chain amino acid transport system ATP-binding protein
MITFRGQPDFFAPSRPGETQAELAITNLSLKFGGISALNKVDLLVRTGEILALIGPKGAGKTSLIECIMGVRTPNGGQILFNGEDITGRPMHYIAGLGIACTGREAQIFPEMTVLSNLLLARHSFYTYDIFRAYLFSTRVRNEETRNRGMAELLIDLFKMQHVRNHMAGALPRGMIKRLEIARAFAMEPRILIIDDPFSGMNREEAEDIMRLLTELNGIRNVSMILIEDDISGVIRIANKVAVMDFGVKFADGTPDFVRNHPKVLKIYPAEI